jgi:hypothetical protein
MCVCVCVCGISVCACGVCVWYVCKYVCVVQCVCCVFCKSRCGCVCVDLFAVQKQAQHAGTVRCSLLKTILWKITHYANPLIF